MSGYQNKVSLYRRKMFSMSAISIAKMLIGIAPSCRRENRTFNSLSIRVLMRRSILRDLQLSSHLLVAANIR